MQKKLLLSLATSVALYATDDLGTITVKDNQNNPYSDIFTDPDYFESQNYLENAPMQKRMTIKEAMNIPGAQGDPVKAIKLFAGVTSSGGSGELVIHASKPRETATTINYLPIGYLFHMQGLHSVIAPEATEQLDVYLGGFDSSYDNAMGAVLDITPKYPSGDNSGFVHVGIFDSSFGYDFKVSDKVNGFIGARRSYFDLFYDKVTNIKEEAKKEEKTDIVVFPNYWDATFFLTYTEGNHLFSFENIAASDNLIVDTQKEEVRDPEATGEVAVSQGFATTGLRWIFSDDNYNANTLFYRRQTDAETRFFEKYRVSIHTVSNGLFHISTHDHEKHQLSYGFRATHNTIPLDILAPRPPQGDDAAPDPLTVLAENGEIFSLSQTFTTDNIYAFMQDIYSISDSLKLRYGLSTFDSSFGEYQTKADLRTALIYEIDEKNHLSFAIGQYTQSPEGFKQVEGFGNPALTDQKSIHYVAHYDHTFDNDYTMEIEPYYKEYKELAIEDRALNYVNKGTGNAYGADLTLKKRSDELYFYATYTYVKSKRQLNNDDKTKHTFYLETPHTVQLAASYHYSDPFVFSILTQYHTGTPYTPIESTSTIPIEGASDLVVPNYGDPFSKRFPDFFTLNLKMAYTEKIDIYSSIEFSFELMNATDNKNVQDIRYDDNYDIEGYNYQLPLLPWFDVTYRF
jgi:hypothetical protein